MARVWKLSLSTWDDKDEQAPGRLQSLVFSDEILLDSVIPLLPLHVREMEDEIREKLKEK